MPSPAQQFATLQKVHKIRVERSEQEVQRARNEVRKGKEAVLAAQQKVAGEEELLEQLFAEMNHHFAQNTIKRSEIEYWRTVIAKQRSAIKEEETKVMDAQMECNRLEHELELVMEEHKKVVQKSDKIDYIFKEVDTKERRENEAAQERRDEE